MHHDATISISISKNCVSEFWFNPSRSNFLEGDTSLLILKPTRPRYLTAVSIITQAKNDKDVIEFFSSDFVIEIICTLVIYA